MRKPTAAQISKAKKSVLHERFFGTMKSLKIALAKLNVLLRAQVKSVKKKKRAKSWRTSSTSKD